MKQNKYKVLLVEDEDNIRNLVATMLDTAGYQTILADSCTDAQMMYTSYLPDLIILDLGLPDMDGMQLLHFVRQNALTPIIVLSARTKESDNWTMVYNNYRLEHNYTGLKIGSNWQGFGIGIKNSGYAYCGEVVNDYRDGHGELYRKNDTLEQWGIYRRGGIKTVYQLP